MKTRSKRVGSFLCFSKPDTKEDETDAAPESFRRRRSTSGRVLSKLFRSTSTDHKQSAQISVAYRPFPDESGKSTRNSNRPIPPNIVRSISNSSNGGGKPPKNASRSITRKELRKETFGKNSHDDDLSSSSSLSSCSSSSCVSPPTKRTFLPPPAKRNYGYATGLCFVLMSLLVMIFCGRVCAILWTITWLCFVPPRRPPEFPEATVAVAVARRLREEEKKRVVLEGFLHRQRKNLQKTGHL